MVIKTNNSKPKLYNVLKVLLLNFISSKVSKLVKNHIIRTSNLELWVWVYIWQVLCFEVYQQRILLFETNILSSNEASFSKISFSIVCFQAYFDKCTHTFQNTTVERGILILSTRQINCNPSHSQPTNTLPNIIFRKIQGCLFQRVLFHGKSEQIMYDLL